LRRCPGVGLSGTTNVVRLRRALRAPSCYAAKTFEPRPQFFDTRVTRFEIKLFREREFACEIFQRLAELGVAVLVNESLPCLRFGALHFESAARVANFAGASIQF